MLEIRHLHLRLHARTLLQADTLQVAPGEVLTVMGPSGAGKSSLLHWLIGDLQPPLHAQGEVWLGGTRRDTLPTQHRRIGILFQDDLLFPHLSVGANLAFALPAGGSTAARRARVAQTLAEIGLAGLHERDPATLSGGQRARVSLMRALLAEPEALLLDEPFARLDATRRAQFRELVFTQVARLGIPTLQVTHDPQDRPAGGRVWTLAGPHDDA